MKRWLKRIVENESIYKAISFKAYYGFAASFDLSVSKQLNSNEHPLHVPKTQNDKYHK